MKAAVTSMLVPHITAHEDSAPILPVNVEPPGPCGLAEAKGPADRSEGKLRPEARLLLACARTQVDAATAANMRSLVTNGIDFSYLIEKADRHFVLSLLCKNLLTVCPDPIPPEVRTRLSTRFRTRMRFKLLQTGELLRVVRLLNSEGIGVLPLKGPLLSAQLYHDISLREFADLDVLVRSSDFYKARSVLASNGYEPATPQSWIERIAPAISRRKDQILHAADSGIRVELHWRLSGGHFSLPLSADDIWLHLETVDLGGLRVHRLPPVTSLLYLCMHGSRHGWERLQWICDIAEFLRAHSGLDWDRVWAEAHALRNERNVALGLYLAHDLLGAHLPDEVLRRITADPAVERLAAQIGDLLFADEPASLDISYWHNYHLRMKERSRDRVKLRLHYYARYLRLVTKPRDYDRSLVRLPGPLGFLHYVLRPARLLAGYSLNQVATFLGRLGVLRGGAGSSTTATGGISPNQGPGGQNGNEAE